MQPLLFGVLGWLLWAASSLVHAATPNLLLSRAYAEDAGGTWTLPQAVQQSYKPFGPGLLSRGYTRSVTWMRLEVAASDEPDLVLDIQPAYLDDVRLFSPLGMGSDGITPASWYEQRTGDQVPSSQRPRQDITLSFTITPSPVHPTVHYLRVQTHNASLFSLNVMTEAESHQQDTLIHLLMGLYVGVFAVMLWQAILRAIASREAVWSALIAFLLITIVHGVVNMGFAAKYLPAFSGPPLDFLNNLDSCTHLVMTIVLSFVLLKTYRAPRLLLWPYAVYLVIYPLQLWLLAQDRAWQALLINSIMVLLSATWGFFAIWFVPFDDWVQRAMMRITNSLIALLGLVMIALPLLGFYNPTKLALYPSMGAYMATALLIFTTLIRRNFLHQQSVEQARLREHALQSALATEQRQRQESASFMSMLLHELKTPLAAIRLATMSMASGRVTEEASRQQRLKAINHSVDDINLVLERTREVDRFEQGMLASHRAQTDVSALLEQALSPLSERARVQAAVAEDSPVEVDLQLTPLMLRNLLENALRYSPPDSPVTVRAFTTASQSPPLSQERDSPSAHRTLHVVVHNPLTARGTPDPQRLFTKYYRADTSHQRTGVGLGLYWVRGVARQLGGDVVHRIQGDAIEFELSLPCN